MNCQNTADYFASLEDDVFDGPSAPAAGKAELADLQQMKMHEEKCKSCRDGSFYSYSGRYVGPCFKCKGKGKGVMYYRQSLEQRNKATAQRVNAGERRRLEIAEQAAAWARDNAEDAAWIERRASSFEFALSMSEALAKYGSLTERQHVAVIKLRKGDAERDAVRAAALEQRNANAKAVSVARVVEAFAAAQAHGIKRPKTYLGEFKFSFAPASGRNAGALYVTHSDSDQYLGKVQDGHFVRARECDADTEAAIVAVANNPHEAAVAFGRRTGRCSCCGRELTNGISIDLGIGPICREKYGWGA
jgi:hypothetical protein